MSTSGIEQGELTAGRELDALVAEKVMGWQPIKILAGTSQAVTLLVAPGHRPEYCNATKPSHYSTEMGAAWSVVEKMRVGTKAVSYAFALRDNSEHGAQAEWVVRFDRYEAEYDQYKPAPEWTSAETAPLAICLASLKAVEEK